MHTNPLRPVEPERDFAQIAALFTAELDDPTTESALNEDYQASRPRILRQMAAQDDRGTLVGFSWLTRSRSDPADASLYLIVSPAYRRRGIGSLLYADLEDTARPAGVHTLKVEVRDHCPAYRAFAARRGFVERAHSIGMTLDLAAFDPAPYNQLVDALRAQGFRFTSMLELGNTEAAQRELYRLNDTAASETMGSDGARPWPSFEAFQQQVCGASWYDPAGQFVVIDTSIGAWAAMSAVTRFAGADYAYNLFTGVEKSYRGRKLAQAVKGLALQYARGALGAQTVKTHHNSNNAPMIAIDRKMGYVQTPGYYAMQKQLDAAPNRVD